MIEEPVNKRSIISTAKLLCSEFGILVKERVEINRPTLAQATHNDGVCLSDFYKRRAACGLDVRLSRKETANGCRFETPARSLLRYCQLSIDGTEGSFIWYRGANAKQFIHRPA